MFHSSPIPARRLWLFLAAVFAAACLIQHGAARAETQQQEQEQQQEQQQQKPAPTPYELFVNAVTPSEAGLGDEIVVNVKNLQEEVNRQESVNEAVDSRIEPYKLVLFINGVEMKKLYPKAYIPSENKLTFTLRRDDDSKGAWDEFLAKPASSESKPMEVSVGPEGKTPWPATGSAKGFKLRIYTPGVFYSAVALFVLAMVCFLLLARYKNIIRDSQPSEPPRGSMKPYSLARAQVAWWFFIILASFLFILMVTGDYNTITPSSLVLLGIGSGTALGAAMVDANKRESANNDLRALKPRQEALAAAIAELRAKIGDIEAKGKANTPAATPEELASLGGLRTDLAAKQAELEQLNVQVADAESAKSKPVSENFIKDVLSDVNGVTFHRFQIVVFTFVLGVIFLGSVWKHLLMPTFNETLLALMGISGVTYLGFKIPERQTEPDAALPAGAAAGAGGNGAGGRDGENEQDNEGVG